jgi:pimeloyl-ACP methyl ester carboxylesterase
MRLALAALAVAALSSCVCFDPFVREIVAYQMWRGDGARLVDVGGGVKIYTEVHEAERRAKRRTTLVLHGGLGATDIMAFQIRDLVKTRRVIAVDTRAHGRSSDPGGALHYDDFAEDFVKVLDALGEKKVDVVGWSDGGIEALLLAEKHPDRIGRIVSISANIRPDGITKEGQIDVDNCGSDKKSGFDDVQEEVRGFYALIGANPDRVASLTQRLCALYRVEPNIGHDELARIEAPSLIMAGDQDLITVEHTKEIAAAIPHATLDIIKGAKHTLPIDIPDVVDVAMLDFLDHAISSSDVH